jgi:hypothetical protein
MKVAGVNEFLLQLGFGALRAFLVSQQPKWGLGGLIVEVSRSYKIKHTHTHTHNRRIPLEE